MKIIFDEHQRGHDPQFRLENSRIVLNPDRPERIGMLLEGALNAGCERHLAVDHGIEPIAAVHTPRYIRYLQTIYEAYSARHVGATEVVPNRFCADPIAHYSYEPDAMVGFHNADTSCPISKHTWQAVYWSAQSALTAADQIISGDTAVYALCRPSGHHAYRETAGGFCYLNNSAIAAEYLCRRGQRPAILDIDVHHGNGTQSIFYDRHDVFTLSLHVDPGQFYPYYAGAANEVGEGRGKGFNQNFPLPRGTDTSTYLRALDLALRAIDSFGATVIIVGLGLDAHKGDPFRGMAVTTEGFADIGRAIRNIGLPTLNVQEGGYMQPELAANLTSYLAACKR